MKRTRTLVKLAALTAMLALPFITRGQGIVGSAHDLSSATGTNVNYKGTSDQTCIYCHTPHNASSSVVALWNKTMTGAGFTPYSSPTLNAGTIGQPAGVSLACLTCHDGTLAVDAYNGNTGNPAHKILPASSAYLGKTLDNDHPISFTYDAALALADGSLKTPDNANGNVGTSKLPLYGLGKNQLECASCHDPHKTTHGNYLRISNASSALCTQCHSK